MEEESNDSDDDVDDGKNVDEVEETHTHTALEFETHCDHWATRGGPGPLPLRLPTCKVVIIRPASITRNSGLSTLFGRILTFVSRWSRSSHRC